MPGTRTFLALAAVAAAAGPLGAQAGGFYRFDGGAFVIDLPAGSPALEARQIVIDGRTAELFTAPGEGRVAVLHRTLPVPGNDTTLSARRALLHAVHAEMLQSRRGSLLSGAAREIVTDDRVTLRIATTSRTAAGERRGFTDVSVARRGGPEMWMVMYEGQAPGAGVEADAARVLDTFRLTGGRSLALASTPVDLNAAAPRVAASLPAPGVDAAAAARLRGAARFSIAVPRGLPPLAARTEVRATVTTAAFASIVGDTSLIVVLVQLRPQPAGWQPTLAGARAVARQALAEWSRAQSHMRPAGEAREIVFPDRLTLRLPVINRESGHAGTRDFSVPRAGAAETWTVDYLARERGPAADSAAARVLDSFRLAAAPRVSGEADSSDLAEWLAGRWGWSFHADPCGPGAGVVDVAADRRSARVPGAVAPQDTGGAQPWTFTVVSAAGGYLRGTLAEHGAPMLDGVIWDVVRLSKDAFCWHATDWEAGMCTAPLRRCPAAPSAGQALRPRPADFDAAVRREGR